MPIYRVLLIEPDTNRLSQYKAALQDKHHWVVDVADFAQAKTLISKQPFQLCILPVGCDTQVAQLYELKQERPLMAVLATSVVVDPALIVKVVRAGATNYWVRSDDLSGFTNLVDETLATVCPSQIVAEDIKSPIPDFVGRHPKVLEIFQLVMSLQKTESSVLITGESGTGKEVIAQAIHSLSPRKNKPWVAVNCGAIPHSLMESELFGHVKGAFTGATQNRMGRFQRAGAGTLFLDEIYDLPLDLQSKLLRAIQTRTFEPVGSVEPMRLDARIIAATNQDLEVAVNQGRFREDLYYRLNVIPVYIPPLRSRKSDIPLLVNRFIHKFAEKIEKPIYGVSEEAMTCLMEYHWPGNIRELENLIERVVVLKLEGNVIDLKDLPVQHFRKINLERFVANVDLPELGLDFNEAVNTFENELILQALQKTDGNKNKAAGLLNLNRTTLVEKLKRKGLRIA